MRRHAALLGLVICGCLATPGSVVGQTFQDFATSDQSVRDVLKGNLGRPRANTYYLLALSAANKGDAREADRNLAIGLRTEPQNVQLLNLKAALLARAGQVQEAVAIFRRILQIAPENEYARASLKWLDVPKPPPPPRVNPKGVKEATPTKPVPIKEDPAQPETPSAAAGEEKKTYTRSFFSQIQEKQRCFYLMTTIKRAQESFEASNPDKKGSLDLEALVKDKLLPATPVCSNGGTYSWNDQGPNCSKHGEFGLLEPEIKSVFADFNEGMKAKFLRSYPEARTSFTKVITLYPNWAEAHYQLADSLFRMGKDKEALEALNKCLKVDAGNLDGQLLLANLCFKTGKKSAALKALETVLKKAPDSVHSLSARSLSAAIRSGRNYYSIFPPE